MNLLARSIRRRTGYRYNSFGVILESSGPMTETFRFRFSTKYHEPVSGLVLYQKRAYCPELGRWLSRDPIGEDGGLNLYSFCGNNPVDNFDALGFVKIKMSDLGKKNGGDVEIVVEGNDICKKDKNALITIKLVFDVPWKLKKEETDRDGEISFAGKQFFVTHQGEVPGKNWRYQTVIKIAQDPCMDSGKGGDFLRIWWKKTDLDHPVGKFQEILVDWDYSCKKEKGGCCSVKKPFNVRITPNYYYE